MAADKQISAARRRQTRVSGWVLSQFQVTLAVCGIVVGFLVCFVVGFLSGVWFQTQEQMMPHDDAITLADDQLDRERKVSSPGREMTFYSALTSREGTPAPKTTPQAAASVPKLERQPLATAAPATSSSKASPSPASHGPVTGESDTGEKMRATPLKATASARPASSESQEETPAVPKPKRETSSAVAPEERFYSIQVGSFRKVEQAYRLQDQLAKKGYQARIGLSIVEGKGAWYRVRVGRYADRGAADKTAQRLQQSERIDVLVMQVSS